MGGKLRIRPERPPKVYQGRGVVVRSWWLMWERCLDKSGTSGDGKGEGLNPQDRGQDPLGIGLSVLYRLVGRHWIGSDARYYGEVSRGDFVLRQAGVCKEWTWGFLLGDRMAS